ncbi:MAG: tRNA1(Val) (adenine(37)-N6)-methyltransferase [Beijerinckiaceae bacterium]
MSADETPFSEDWFLDGRLLLRQPLKGHRVGTDALLLAAITSDTGRICDLGSGVGAVGLALVLRAASAVVMIERNRVFADLARYNLRHAHASDHVQLIEADIFDRKAFLREPALADQSFDAVATNPPFDQVLRGRKTPTALKHAAHAMQGGDLEDWLKAAMRLLKEGGMLSLIHRADRLNDVLNALPKRAGAITIRPVQPQADQAATRLLVTAIAGSRAPLSILPPFVLHESDGRFTAAAALVHKGQARLTMQPGPVVEETV